MAPPARLAPERSGGPSLARKRFLFHKKMAPPARLASRALARDPSLFFDTKKARRAFDGSPGQTRTGNLEVNSFLLHH